MFAKVAPALVLALFIGLWILAVALLGLFGGWRSLAASYAAPEGFEFDSASRFSFRSIQLRRGLVVRTRYGGSMTVGLTPQGLYLVPFALFRFFHKPLLIPWTAITNCEDGSFLWTRWVDMTLGEGQPVLRLYGAVSDAAWGEWRSRVRPSGSTRAQ